jgi:hypothetical protein
LVTEMEEFIRLQAKKCRKYGAEFLIADSALTVGVSADLFSGHMPLNGLRHPPAIGTTGWFLWSGIELSNDPNFFVPVHLHHLLEGKSPILPFLGLAPGWRFLTDGISEDVWYDKSLFCV